MIFSLGDFPPSDSSFPECLSTVNDKTPFHKKKSTKPIVGKYTPKNLWSLETLQVKKNEEKKSTTEKSSPQGIKKDSEKLLRGQKKISFLKNKKKPSSQRWLLRHLNDPFVQQAQIMGYRSRAVFKLQELQDTFHIIPKHPRVLDLGAAPGGWSQYIQKINPQSFIVAVDLLTMEEIPGVLFLQGDMLEDLTTQKICFCCKKGYIPSENEEFLTHNNDHSKENFSSFGEQYCNTSIVSLEDHEKFNLVLSDMAPTSTGHGPTDLLRMEALMEQILDLSQSYLNPGGNLVLKAYHHPFLKEFKKFFSKVHFVKPKASRHESQEIYVVALNFQRK